MYYFSTFTYGEFLNISMPYYSKNLSNFLDPKFNKQFNFALKIEIIYQILNVVKLFHQNNICHRNLKLENIFIESLTPLSIRIGGLGQSKKMYFEEYSRQIIGSSPYRAPELMFNKKHFFGIDIWAVGIISVQFFINYRIEKGLTSKEILEEIETLIGTPNVEDQSEFHKNFFYPFMNCRPNLRTFLIEKVDENQYKNLLLLLQNLLTFPPEFRPTADDILNLPIFKNYVE